VLDYRHQIDREGKEEEKAVRKAPPHLIKRNVSVGTEPLGKPYTCDGRYVKAGEGAQNAYGRTARQTDRRA